MVVNEHDKGFGRPFFFMTSGQRGLSLDHSEAALLDSATPGYYLNLSGSTHNTYTLDFSILASVYPEAFSPAEFGTINGIRAAEIINAYLIAFFDQHLKQEPVPLFGEPSPDYVEVQFRVVREMSDLQGIRIAEEAKGESTPPEAITAQELAARTRNAYLLKDIPEGYSLEIIAVPDQPEGGPFNYDVIYRNEAGDILNIRSGGMPIGDVSWSDETYTTASGLVFYFWVESGVEHGTSAIFKAPNILTSHGLG